MKANNGKGNKPSRDHWETPQWLFDSLDKQYKFKFDCCASKSNAKIPCFTEDFLSCSRTYNPVWMNPPFSKALDMFKHFFKVVSRGVTIYRCDNFETKIWQEVIFPNATWIFIPNKRIVYEGMDGKGSRFPSALIGFNVKQIKELGGITLKPSEKRGELNSSFTKNCPKCGSKCKGRTVIAYDCHKCQETF